MNEPAVPIVISTTEALLVDILVELRRHYAQDDDLWEAEQIAAYMKLKKKSVQTAVLPTPGFPTPIIVPTGGRRWVAKEIKAWVMKNRHS